MKAGGVVKNVLFLFPFFFLGERDYYYSYIIAPEFRTQNIKTPSGIRIAPNVLLSQSVCGRIRAHCKLIQVSIRFLPGADAGH